MISLIELEKALKSYLDSSTLLDCEVFAAHEAKIVPVDFLQVAAGPATPTCEGDEAQGESIVTFLVRTGGFSNASAAAERSALHELRVRSLDWLFGEENSVAAVAALNALATPVGFSGWQLNADQQADLRNEEEGTLVSQRAYLFEYFQR